MNRQQYLAEYRKTYGKENVEYYRKYGSAYYQENKEKVNERKKKDRQNKKLRAIEFLGGKCYDCQLKSEYADVYDFHHLDPTQKEIGVNRILGNAWDKIKEELEKCVLLCANCHRIRHYKERE